jgi:hypothetical protein
VLTANDDKKRFLFKTINTLECRFKAHFAIKIFLTHKKEKVLQIQP